MKRTNALIAAVLVTSTLTACNGVGTAGVTETSAKTEESVTTVSEETTTAENTSEAYTESQTVTTAEETSISADSEAKVSAPDKAFLLDLCTKWLDEGVLENGKSFALGGSPVGTVTALYTDIDGDLTAEFCFIVDAYGSSALYVCDYINEAWKVTDILTIAKQYTYLQKTDNGATSLFAVVGSRAAEGLTSYVYNNGVEEAFEMFDYTAFYDNELAAAENADDVYYKAIENAISKYDNLTYLYDLPCVTADLVNDVRFLGSDFAPDGFDSDAVQTKFDAFTAEVATLFQ